jgi:hypothetical protein
VAQADRLHFVWQPQGGSQYHFLRCPHFECLYHGTRGPGKTDALLMDFAQHVGRGFGGAWRGILFRQTYPQLEEVRAKTKRWFPQFLRGARWNGSQSKWIFPEGEELLLRHMARPGDYWSYHGHEYPWIGWEELTNWPTADCYEAMMACCRSSHREMPRKVRATCNPYGSGHNWVKARFIDAAPQGEIIGAEEGLARVHLFGAIAENEILLEADPHYVERLKADSNAHRRKAWLEGSWDIVAGGLFDDLWDPRVHVVARFPVPESWRVDRALDWGSTQPFSVGWWAESDGTDFVDGSGATRPTVRGDLYRIAEWYGCTSKPNEGLKLTARKVALGILEKESDLGYDVRPGPADSHIFSDAKIGRDIAADMAAAGLRWTKALKDPGSRRIGAERLRALLAGALPRADGPREQPGLFVFADCRHFIRTVPVLPRGTKDPDDVDPNAEDHVYDETRYRIMVRKGLGGEKRISGFH